MFEALKEGMKEMRGEMQSMGLDIQAGQGALKKELQEAKGKMAKEIGMIRGEVNELKGSVKGVWSAMEVGKKDVTGEIITVGQEVDKLGQGMKKVKEGQDQLRRETKKELEAVKKECKTRHEEMTEMVKEMGRKAEIETQGMGVRLDRHIKETEEEVKLVKGGLVETQGEVEKVKDDLEKAKDVQARMEGKVEDMKVELVDCVETRCRRQDGLLMEQGERIRSLEADRNQVGPVSLNEVRGLHDAGVCMPSLGRAEATGSLGLMRAPSMTVPASMQNASLMAWGSKQDGAECAPTQTGVVNSPGEWLGLCGGRAPLESGGSVPPCVPQGLGGGVRTPKGQKVPLPPYDGKTDLMASLAQFHFVARGNGWDQVQGMAQLTAALRGAASEVLTTIPLEGATLADLYSALNNRFGMEQQSELVKAQLRGRKRHPHETIGELAHDIRRAVGIAHANMAPEYREELALDYFVQALAGTDIASMLTTWRPENLQKAADTAARWEASRLPAGGAGRHAVAIRQVGPVNNGALGAGDTLGDQAQLEKMVQGMIDRELLRSGPKRSGPGGAGDGPSGGTPIRNERGYNSEYRRHTPYQAKCFNCGKEGHLQWRCKALRREEPRPPRSPTPPRADRNSRAQTSPPHQSQGN